MGVAVAVVERLCVLEELPEPVGEPVGDSDGESVAETDGVDVGVALDDTD